MHVLVAYRVTKRADRHVIVTLNYEDILDFADNTREYRVFSYELDPATGRGVRRDLDQGALQSARERREAEARERAAREELEREEMRRWLESDAYRGFLRAREAERRRAELQLRLEEARRNVKWSAKNLEEVERDLAADHAYLEAGVSDPFYAAKAAAIRRRISFYEEAVAHRRKQHESNLAALASIEAESRRP